ncbi:hypothetical protein CL684_01505 [Candidatus Campbellbacteria bacterium]|nr:hypothetical protein [Candidatus Campbellbacteria bacterium]|tara:strand:+ start:324 stop:836 length:513 start_codon:yes stop_codon:yes gene_type:complete
MKYRGFTLIELLVVIAIIGILSAIVVSALGSARTNARIAATETELDQLEKLIVSAQYNTNTRVIDLTNPGGNGTFDSCPNDVSGLSGSSLCVTDWQTAIDTLTSSSLSNASDGSGFYEDPWGSPYLLDENEGEVPANPCRNDVVFSAGPDQLIGTTSDNIEITIPFESCN